MLRLVLSSFKYKQISCLSHSIYELTGNINYADQTGLGFADPGRSEIAGNRIANHMKRYRLHVDIAEQLIWMKRDS
jgi:hypothetical protein